MVVLQCVILLKNFLVSDDDVLVGKIGGIPFYISETQHTAWKNTDLIIDCIKGMGGMFSLDNGTGRRFLTRSEICIPDDAQRLISFNSITSCTQYSQLLSIFITESKNSFC